MVSGLFIFKRLNFKKLPPKYSCQIFVDRANCEHSFCEDSFCEDSFQNFAAYNKEF